MKMKRIISVILLITTVFALSACAKISDVKGNNEEVNEGLASGDDVHAGKTEKKETSKNILVLGHDRAARLTDVMMLVNFDTQSGKMTITQLPRDTYMEYGGSYYKINGLYNRCIGAARDEGSEDSEFDGLIKAKNTLSKALGIKIHHAAVMDLDGFSQIVDSVGGVYMYVPYSMFYQDPEQNLYISLLEGYQTLTGAKAEQFVRFRSGYIQADIARGDAQKMFMTAFVEAVKNNISVTNVAGIAETILQNVKTDMSLSQIVEMGKAFLNVELSGITMMTLPGEGCTSSSGASFYVMNKACMVEILAESYNTFEEEYTADSFDEEGVFCNEGDSRMQGVYDKSAEDIRFEKHNAQDVSDKDIPIQLK